MTHRRRFPAGPLLEIAERRTLDRGTDTTSHSLAAQIGVTRETVQRWQTHPDATLAESFADRLACQIGLHPCEVWPEWFAESVPA